MNNKITKMTQDIVGDVFVRIPCKEGVNGELCLLVDTGADTSLVKERALVLGVSASEEIKKYLSGACGGGVTTTGMVEIQHDHAPKLRLKLETVDLEGGIPRDGLLVRDML